MEAPKRPKPSRRKNKNGPMRSKAKTSKLTVADRVNKRKRLSELQREIEDLNRRIEAETSLGEIVKLRRLFQEKDNDRDRLYKEVMAMNNGKIKNVVDVPFLLKKMTIQERRAKNKTKNKVEMRPRIIAQTLKLKDRKALNLERMYQLKKNEELAQEEAEKKRLKDPTQEDLDLDEPDFDLADLVGVQDKIPRINATLKLKDRNALNLERMYQDAESARLKEMQPRVKYDVSEKAYYAMKEDGDVPKELRSMGLKPLKKRPKPKRSNVSL
jgi:hypothetical protein